MYMFELSEQIHIKCKLNHEKKVLDMAQLDNPCRSVFLKSVYQKVLLCKWYSFPSMILRQDVSLTIAVCQLLCQWHYTFSSLVF